MLRHLWKHDLLNLSNKANEHISQNVKLLSWSLNPNESRISESMKSDLLTPGIIQLFVLINNPSSSCRYLDWCVKFPTLVLIVPHYIQAHGWYRGLFSPSFSRPQIVSEMIGQYLLFLTEQRKWLWLFTVSVEQSTFALTVPALCRPAAVKQLYAHLLLLLDFIYKMWSGDMLYSSKYEMLEECLPRFDVNILHYRLVFLDPFLILLLRQLIVLGVLFTDFQSALLSCEIRFPQFDAITFTTFLLSTAPRV